MDQATVAGLLDELVKIAVFGPEQVQRVLGAAKKVQLPKASGRVVPSLTGGPSLPRAIGDMARALREPGMSLQDARAAAQELTSYSPAAPMMGKKPVIFPGRGALPKQVAQAGAAVGVQNIPRVPAEQQKMLHGVIKGHELDEGMVRGATGVGHLGHRSPDVIYREHNRLVSMPPGNEDVLKTMRHVRGTREAPWLFDRVGLEYGKGPRLSRHARRRLTESTSRLNDQLSENPELQKKLLGEFASEKFQQGLKKYMSP